MKATILFAEDERGIRRYSQQEFQADGYRVLTAVDGIEALETLETSVVDLVILDEHMPRCNGLEAASHIKRWYPNLPVILFTADQDLERYKGVLVDATVMKSEDIGELKTVAARLLEQKPKATNSVPVQSSKWFEKLGFRRTDACN